LYSLAGDLAAPLINRNAIKAEFSSANARQIQAMYNYERVILNAFRSVKSTFKY
jgi:outer membrane protein TolC